MPQETQNPDHVEYLSPEDLPGRSNGGFGSSFNFTAPLEQFKNLFDSMAEIWGQRSSYGNPRP